MPVLINPQGSAIDVKDEDASSLLKQGYGVPLNDPSGKPIVAPFDQAQDLVRSGGHTQPTEAQLQDLLSQAHYSTPKQKALTFMEGALQPLTFGLSGKALEKMGISTAEDQLERAQRNPGTSTAGQIAGTGIGTLLVPESAAGVIGKASQAASKAIQIEGRFGPLAQMVTKNALESAAFSASHEVNEYLLGDPNQTAESALRHIGLSGALGGAISLALTPPLEALGGNVEKNAIEKVVEKAQNLAQEKFPGMDPMEGVSHLLKLPFPVNMIPGAKSAKDYLINKLMEAGSNARVMDAVTHLQNFSTKTLQAIGRESGAIFGPGVSEIISPDETTLKPELHPLSTLVQDYSNNPQKMMDHLTNASQNLQETMPNTMQALTSTITKAVEFLQGQLPPEGKDSPLDKSKIPNQEQIGKFNRMASLIQDPISILQSIKTGTLAPNDMKAVSMVYPNLYDRMQQTVLSKMAEAVSKKKEIPYRTQMGLSMFLGQTLESTLSPQNIQSNQNIFQAMNTQRQAMTGAKQARVSKTGMSRMKPLETERTPFQMSLGRKR